jgi:hypothetical protein
MFVEMFQADHFVFIKIQFIRRKGGITSQGTALQARIARYLIIRYLEFEFYLPFYFVSVLIDPLFQHSKRYLEANYTDECKRSLLYFS